MSSLLQRPVGFALTLFLLVLLSRLGYAVMDRSPAAKLAETERAALNLVEHGELANVFGPDSGPSAHIAPAYAGLLAGTYKLFGLPADNKYLPQRFLAILATAITIALIPTVAGRAGFHPWTGPLVALLLAASPLNLFLETFGIWEHSWTALMLLLLLWCFLALHDCQWASRRLILTTSLAIGIGALLSPIALLAAMLMIGGEFLAAKEGRGRILRGATVMGAFAALCLAPWVLRNWLVLGEPILTRSNFGLELFIGNNPQANGRSYVTSPDDPHTPFAAWHPYCSPKQLAHLREIGELAYMRERKQQAMTWIEQHPADFAALTMQRFRLFWFPDEDEWAARTTALRPLRVWIFGGISALMFAGLLSGFLIRSPYRWLLAAILLGPSLPYLITHVELRYRYQLFALSVLVACDFLLRQGALLVKQQSRSPEARQALNPARRSLGTVVDR